MEAGASNGSSEIASPHCNEIRDHAITSSRPATPEDLGFEQKTIIRTTHMRESEIERKRQALLSMPDWAGLHVPPQSASAVKLHSPHATRSCRTPHRKTLVEGANDRDGNSDLQTIGDTDTGSNSSSFDVDSSCSSYESIISPTPTYLRVKKPVVHSERSESLQQDRSITEDFNHESNESCSTSQDSYLSEVKRVLPDGKTYQNHKSDRFDWAAPPWIRRISETLGFSPPNSINKFEKQITSEVESHHTPQDIHLETHTFESLQTQTQDVKPATIRKESPPKIDPTEAFFKNLGSTHGQNPKKEKEFETIPASIDERSQPGPVEYDHDRFREGKRMANNNEQVEEKRWTESSQIKLIGNEETHSDEQEDKESKIEKKIASSKSKNTSLSNEETKNQKSGSSCLWKTMVFKPKATDQLDLFFPEINDAQKIF